MADPEEKPIRVVDRRMFTREGELRPGIEPEESPAPTPTPTGSAPIAEAATAPTPEAPPSPEGPAAPGPDSGRPASPDFLFLVQFLYSNALAALGVDPVTGTALPRRDLTFGQRMIEALAALEAKTRGNLSFEESNLLSQVLYQLRMDYVDATRAPSPGPGGGPPTEGPGRR